MRKKKAQETAFCTIVSRDFMPRAMALHRSLKKHYRELDFTALITDPRPLKTQRLPVSRGFKILSAEELGVPCLNQLRKYYSPFELCNIFRPFLIRKLMKKDRAQKVIYLDADIYVTGRFDFIEKKLNKYFYAFTTHTVKSYPLDRSLPNDRSLLDYGVFNSGFQAFRNHPQCHRILEWLMPRLMLYGFNDPPHLYVDQKLLPLVPIYFPSGFLPLFHPGYNIAYWNLHEREIIKKGARYFANGAQAVFFHFSGYDLKRPGEWTQRGAKEDPSQPEAGTRTLRRPCKRSLPALKKVLEEYRDLLKDCSAGIDKKGKKTKPEQKRSEKRALFFREFYPELLRKTAFLKW